MKAIILSIAFTLIVAATFAQQKTVDAFEQNKNLAAE